MSRLDVSVMSALRRMTAADFAALPDVSEGLEYRLEKAAHSAADCEEFLTMVKTRRYAMSRLRRVMLSAYLGMTRELAELSVPYARILALNSVGAEVLRGVSAIPVISKTADGVKLGGDVERLLRFECFADDLYALAYEKREERRGGQGIKTSPIFRKTL
jgi:hypothetical protein